MKNSMLNDDVFMREKLDKVIELINGMGLSAEDEYYFCLSLFAGKMKATLDYMDVDEKAVLLKHVIDTLTSFVLTDEVLLQMEKML